MSLVTSSHSDNEVILRLRGRLDSNNADEAWSAMERACRRGGSTSVVVDCSMLDYVSSAGLRVLLRLKKEFDDLHLIEVVSKVYDIFEMTGFVEMMDIKKALRRVSVEGCEVIGEGASGKIYRIAPDTVVKVFNKDVQFDEIERSRELSRTVFVWGVPTAIPYDVVRVGEHFGAVYELLDAENLAQVLARHEKPVEEVAACSIDLLKQIHEIESSKAALPSAKEVGLGWIGRLRDHLPAETFEKVQGMIAGLPDSEHLVHGDYHLKNIMQQGSEMLLIDMDTLSHGHPIFDFASMFNAYEGFGVVDRGSIERFMGVPYELIAAYWNAALHCYFADADEQELAGIEHKIKLMGYTHLMDHAIRGGDLNKASGRVFVERCKAYIIELAKVVDTLVF